MPPKPVRNPKFDDAYLVRLRLAAAAEEWSERAGKPLREAWRRIAFWTRRQLIKPFPTVESFEDFRGRNRDELRRYRESPQRPAPTHFFRSIRQDGLSKRDIEEAGYRIVETDVPTFCPHLKEDREFAVRTVRTLRKVLRQDPKALDKLLWDYARLLGDMQPDRRNRTFRWQVYKDMNDGVTGTD